MKLTAKFGMCEMETAAEIILNRAIEAQTWDINVRLADFGDGSDGFLQLLAYGWLKPNYLGGKSEFKVTPGFIERVDPENKLNLPPPFQWSLIPDFSKLTPPTQE